LTVEELKWTERAAQVRGKTALRNVIVEKRKSADECEMLGQTQPPASAALVVGAYSVQPRI
jgi:hypothetical protein